MKVDEELGSNSGVQTHLTSEPSKSRAAPKKHDIHEQNPGISNDLFSEANSSKINRLIYLCDVCKSIVSDKNELKTHSLLCSGKCPYTFDVFKNSSSELHSFERQQHAHRRECLPCSICKTSCTECSHVHNAAIRDRQRPYSCETCDKAFKHPSDLKKHLRIHTGERPFSCNTCDKAFNQSSVLKRHMRMHTGELTFYI